MAPRWTPEAARAWYAAHPWPVGANFIPSTAINQLEMWQAETFDPAVIDRELGYAAGLGMNVMRVYLHDLLWEQDAAGFCARIDRYLALAAGHGIRTLFVIFDDCWNREFTLGPQPAPIPFTHNSGWVQSPGVRVVEEPAAWPCLERYVTGLLSHFRADARILGWDLYNEPGNGAEQPEHSSLPLLDAAFAWARGVDGLTQPLTTALWNFSAEYAALNAFALAQSDLITFHHYGPPQDLAERLHILRACDRPLLCSEYMARGAGSTFDHCLPILHRYRVGAINWGLVAGKTQTIYPWGWGPDNGDPEIWFHDIFWPDGRLIYPNEAHVFQQLTEATAR